MNKTILLLSLLLSFSFKSFAQLLEGDLLTDKRKVVSDIIPIITPSNYDGKILFSISVDNSGTITSAKVIEDKTTINSTPARIKATNLIYNVKFEAGSYFPKYHTGVYQINYKKN